MAEILPGPAVAQGTWPSMKGHLLVRMHDGNVLDWNSYEDPIHWELREYTPGNKKNVLAAPFRSGHFQFTGLPVQMSDNRLLLWHYGSGEWRLLNYDPKSKDVFTEHSSGVRPDIVSDHTPEDVIPTVYSTHRLIGMPGGDVLDWGPMELGIWRLWSYTPMFFEPPDFKPNLFPTMLGVGAWKDILGGIKKGLVPHRLIPMLDDRILDWNLSDNSYRLWDYTPEQAGDQKILAGYETNTPVTSGMWPDSKWGPELPDHLVPMQDGRVLAWSDKGPWSLWNYELPARYRRQTPAALQGFFADIDPLARIISMSLYATLTKPRPALTQVRSQVGALTKDLRVSERRALADQVKVMKQYIGAIEAALLKR